MTFFGQIDDSQIAKYFNLCPDGGTHLFDFNSNRRYVVGMSNTVPTAYVPVGYAITSDYVALMRQTAQQVQADGIGIWRNAGTGLIEMDAVRTFDDFEEAMAFAQEENQICFYDLETDHCVYTDDKAIAV